MNESRKIYILLTHTGSLFSTLIKRYIKEPYTHVSIAFDSELNEIYSFGRKVPNNPLIAGFVREDINNGTYKRFKETTYALYSLEISNQQYNKLRKVISEFKKAEEKSGYNLIGLIGVICGVPINRKYHYFCSQFIACILQKSSIHIFDKHPGLVIPSDFRKSKHLKFIGSGILREHRKKVC